MAALETKRKLLRTFGQEHLLTFYDELDRASQSALLEQISGIDFEQLTGLIRSHVLSEPTAGIPANPSPAPILPSRPADEVSSNSYHRARRRGEELISTGRVAGFVVAGGEGTRLGFDGPKGCFPVTPVRHKSLFQVFAEQILSAVRRYGATIPWYIMTSQTNDGATREFFNENNYFGLNRRDVFLFTQGQMPVTDLNGKILLSDKGSIAFSGEGHGGCLSALRQSGALDDMAARGIEYISYFQVDNPLNHCIDPLFIGLTADVCAEMSAKAIPKRGPMEKLGNFCMVDGKVTVIEYSDLPEEAARQTKRDGSLVFSSGSIAIHILSRRFVERLTADGHCRLPFHRAIKKSAYIDPSGTLVEPAEPNAVKFERFVFDAMPLAEKVVVLETLRSEEFSPVKNADGEGSPATSIRDQVRRAARWLESAGLTVPKNDDGEPDAVIEISPLLASDAEQLAENIDPNLKIKAGENVYLDTPSPER
ncbi:MAG: UDPGP type 1 family protein [Planctomycetota bacterium]|nr:UDPGP type 1 family protein [Planctomycetota bacterium]